MGEIRIISGRWRGRRIKVAPRMRPTADRVRTSLFDRLSPILPGAKVLDLFAGTGALGLEALSRGALRALFVEKSPAILRVLEMNVAELEAEGSSVRLDEAFHAVRTLSRSGETFDLVLADPPYGVGLAGRVVALLEEEPILSGSGTLVVEHDRREKLPPVSVRLDLGDERRYGDTLLTFYKGR